MRRFILAVCVAALSSVSAVSYAAKTVTARGYDVVKVEKERNPKAGVDMGFMMGMFGFEELYKDVITPNLSMHLTFMVKDSLFKSSRIPGNGAIFFGAHGFYGQNSTVVFHEASTFVTPFTSTVSQVSYGENTCKMYRPEYYGGALRATFHYKVARCLDFYGGVLGGVMVYNPHFEYMNPVYDKWGYEHYEDRECTYDNRIVYNEDVDNFINLYKKEVGGEEFELNTRKSTLYPYVGGIIGMRLKPGKPFGFKFETVLGKYTPYLNVGFFFNIGKHW